MPTRIPNSYPVTDLLAPYNYEDSIPILDYRFGLGGFRTVGSTTDLLIPSGAGEATDQATPDRSITSLRRKKGMVVYVEGVTAFYGLFSSTADSAWEVVGPRYFKGGFRSLGTTAQMEAIRDEMREEGMVVYVSGVTAYYALIGTTANSGWTTGFTMGNGGGGGTPFDSNTSYTWTAPQYFSAGFSAAGGVTFNNNVVFNNGLSASGGATFSSIYGTALAIGTFYPNPVGSAEINNSGIITATGIRITNTSIGATFSNKVFVGELLSVQGGISANGGVTFANNVHVGGTLSVDGNFYVAGTMTTVNESQLLIQDKYLVLGSTLGSMAEYGTSAGIYIGTTTAPIASFAYNYNSGTDSHWVSNIPLYVGADEVLTRGNISTATGITADRVRINNDAQNQNFSVVLTTPAGGLSTRVLVTDSNSTGALVYNPFTNILTVNKIEAIVDGGEW